MSATHEMRRLYVRASMILAAGVVLFLLSAWSCCAQNIGVTLTVNTTNKSGRLSAAVSLRETVDVTLAGNALSFNNGGLQLAIVDGTNLLAVCTNFNASYVGAMSFNTTNLVAEFDGMSDTAQRSFTWLLMDIQNSAVLMNYRLPIQNNPYVSGMASPEALAWFGSTNFTLHATFLAHDHLGGDGATIAHSSLSGIGTNSHAHIDDIMDLITTNAAGTSLKINQLLIKDDVSGKWRRIYLTDGAITLGVEED